MKTRSIAAAAVAILAVVAIVLTIIGYFGIHRRQGPVPTQTAPAPPTSNGVSTVITYVQAAAGAK